MNNDKEMRLLIETLKEIQSFAKDESISEFTIRNEILVVIENTLNKLK